MRIRKLSLMVNFTTKVTEHEMAGTFGIYQKIL